MHDSCGNGVLSIVELLLDRGANATLKNDLGDTPLQTLAKWREDRVLSPQEQDYYDIVRVRLLKHLEKAGVKITDKTPRKVIPRPSTSMATSKATPRKRILNDLISSKDEENRLPDSEVVETIDNILEAEFPTHDSNSRSPSPEYHVDYRDVMTDLRKGNFQNKVDAISDSFKPVEKITRRSAMLAGDEVSTDDWLEDDLAPNVKRRRYLNEKSYSNDSNVLGSSKKVNSKLPGASSNDSNIVSSSNNVILSDDSEEENAFNVLMNTNQNNSFTKRKRHSTSNALLRRPSNDSTQQSSLIENGFYRHRGSATDSAMMSVSSTVPSPHKLSPHKLPSIPQSYSIKVQVSDLYLNIPVNVNSARDLTMEWLAEEAAKRYYG